MKLVRFSPLLALLAPFHALAAKQCGGVTVSDAFFVCPSADSAAGASSNPIFVLIDAIITFATGALGLVLVLMIVIAGLEYVISGGNPDKAKGAKRRIEQAATGFVLFVIMWGVLQVLLPQGIFQ